MTEPSDDPSQIPRIRISRASEIASALDAMALDRGRPVLVLVGGAGGMTKADMEMLRGVFRQAVLPLLERLDVVVVDGGTDSGVMRILGQVRAAGGGRFPLVGVAAEGTVAVPDGALADPDAAELEPHHTHLILVPGRDWGDESPWLVEVADTLAAGAPSVTLVVNGGEITYDDVAGSLARGRPVVVLAGTGRTADAIAAARSGQDEDPRAVAIASSVLTHVASAADADGIVKALDAVLDGGP